MKVNIKLRILKKVAPFITSVQDYFFGGKIIFLWGNFGGKVIFRCRIHNIYIFMKLSYLNSLLSYDTSVLIFLTGRPVDR